MQSTLKPPESQPPNVYLILPDRTAAENYFRTCPRAQSLTAYSAAFRCWCLLTLPCGTWNCRVCSVQKIKRLAATVSLAAPNRLLTLTVNPALYASRRDAWQNTRKKVPLLIRRLRKKFGEIEYLRVTEVTSKGWPHYHLLIRSGYLPHSVIKAYWSEMTGATIVDIRQVTKSWSAYKYLVKYLSKLHNLEWTERHVSTSRGFLPKSDFEPEDQLNLIEKEVVNEHPVNVVRHCYDGMWIRRVSANAYLITDEEPRRDITATPS